MLKISMTEHELNDTSCPYLGVYCSLSQPGLELVEDDGDGVQLLVSHRGHDQLLGEGGRGHHGVRGELLECRVEQHAVISEMNFKSFIHLSGFEFNVP